ncbi:MAG: hypothetical protein M3118_01195 [Actinomycetota bacterium]|nr:hypothetical protein [Actinomycetota bacterium]
MNNLAESVAVRLARAWVSLYTRGLRAETRDARRAEIESDLWEYRHDISANGSKGLAASVLGRVLAGVPADISWSIEEYGSARGASSMDDRSDGQMKLQKAIILGISVVAVTTAMVMITGLPTATSALLGGLGVLAMVGLINVLVRSPIGAVSGVGKENYMDANTYRSRRKRLLVVLGVCVATLLLIGAYAFSLESWGETLSVVFNIVGFVLVAVGLVALVLLVADLVRARRT